jgi:hypothetical protein
LFDRAAGPADSSGEPVENEKGRNLGIEKPPGEDIKGRAMNRFGE